jgi:hypothetical protein
MTADELNTLINTFIALKLANYALMKLVDGDSVECLVTEFDNGASFIDGVIDFLIDMKWVEYNYARGLYQMTKIGEREVRTSASKVILWRLIALDFNQF